MPEKPMDVFEFLDFANDLNFRLVQIGDNMPLESLAASDLFGLKKKADKLGISIEVGTRGMTEDHVLKYIEIADFLDSPILRMVIDGQGYIPEMSDIHPLIHKLTPEFEQRRIQLAIENHDRLKASQFLEIIEKAASPWVGICLDPVNSIGADEGFETVFKTLAPHTINFHLKDYIIRRKPHMMGFDISGAPAGQGRLDIEHIFLELKKHKRCRSVILELWPVPEESIDLTIKKEQEWVRQSAHFLFEIFKA